MKFGIYEHFKGGTALVYDIVQLPDGDKAVSYLGLQDKKRHTRTVKSFEEKIKGYGRRFVIEKDFVVRVDEFINNLKKNKQPSNILVYDTLDNSEGELTVSYIDLNTGKHYNREMLDFIEFLESQGIDSSLYKFKEGVSSALNGFLNNILKENYDETYKQTT